MTGVVEIIICGSRSEWLAKRRALRSTGASQATAILGESQYGTARSLFHECRGEIEPEDVDSDAAYWGTVLEEPIRAHALKVLGATNLCYHSAFEIRKRGLQHATLDGIISEPTRQIIELFDGMDEGYTPTGEGVLEVKTASQYLSSRWNDAEQDWPLPYQIQTQQQLAVTGYEWGIAAALIGGQRFTMRPFRAHQEFQARLAQAIEEFWHAVDSGTPPEIDGSESNIKLLKRLHPDDNGSEVSLPVDFCGLDDDLVSLKVDRKEIKDQIDDLEAKIKAKIGGSTFGSLPTGASYSWKSQTRREYTVPESTFRVLRRHKA
ncbi:MAG: YqaJ viral recombinase family protein [Planctomycetota bacterium]|nr:YqaJ viral recombinase family protein [Planctomycetota bacterium]